MAENENPTAVVETENPTENQQTESNKANANDPGAAENHAEDPELAKLKIELAKLKEATNRATSEAAAYKKQLRAKQSEEEIAAEEKKAQDEARDKEIEELRKEVARAKTVKTVMSRLGTDEEASGKIAEYLYGAEDAEAALTEIQRAWTAREKALKLEYGRIPAPGAGGDNNEDAEAQKAIRLAQEIGRTRATANKSVRSEIAGYMR